ncbi:site-specific integrase [Granulicella paludicola]|uniref:site-specific integrase n=1 Tax=Granulicella paludicola TaxID=474951 RepID=UPI0021E04201|nr:site-specific integrase [Granulicella paludicola]
MAQQGSLYQDHGCWYVRYWEVVQKEDGTTERKHPAHRLASVKEYPKKSDVLPLKNQFMDRLNRIGFTPGSGVSLVDFVEKTFLPGCERRLTGSSTRCYRQTWTCYLKPYVADVRIRDVRPVHLQQLLHAVEQERGTSLAHGTYKTMKVTLSAIFTEARNLGLYDGTNPVTGVRIPKGRKHGRRRLAYSLDEILQHLELFSKDPIVVPQRLPRRRTSSQLRRKRIAGGLAPETENLHIPKITAAVVRAIIGVTAFAGLRKGEIRGLWWDDDRIDLLAICRSVWNSTIKNTKTEEDVDDPGLVPVIRPLRLLLDAIKPEHAAGFIFISSVNGAIDLDNLASRVVKPIFEANGMEWKGWQAYRRGLATNLKELGVEDTTIQCILRHENVSTTQRFYIKTAPRVAQEAMRILEEKIACTAVVQQR